MTLTLKEAMEKATEAANRFAQVYRQNIITRSINPRSRHNHHLLFTSQDARKGKRKHFKSKPFCIVTNN